MDKDLRLLKTFTPPRGTTKTVELTLAERKTIGRNSLAKYVTRFFDNNSVTVKYHGAYFTIRHTGRSSTVMFRVSIRRNQAGQCNLNPMPHEVFQAWLAKNFEATILLRIIKLIEKNTRDKDSVDRQKMIKANRESRARILVGNYNLSDL